MSHAVLLFEGRMIDRRMGHGEETAPILPHPMTTSLSAGLVKDLKITNQYCRELKHFRNSHLQPKMSLEVLNVNSS